MTAARARAPSPAAAWPTGTQSFTYESAFDKVATATDARGKVTSYSTPGAALRGPVTVIGPGTGLGVAMQTHVVGAMRDADVIAAADAAGIAMVFTGMRHFRH